MPLKAARIGTAISLDIGEPDAFGEGVEEYRVPSDFLTFADDMPALLEARGLTITSPADAPYVTLTRPARVKVVAVVEPVVEAPAPEPMPIRHPLPSEAALHAEMVSAAGRNVLPPAKPAKPAQKAAPNRGLVKSNKLR